MASPQVFEEAVDLLVSLGAERAAPTQPYLGKSPDSRALTVFLHSLATMVGAGLNIGRCLEILGRQKEDPALQQVVTHLSGRVLGGHPLWASMADTPVFSPVDVHLVRVGETSGQLPTVLANLATYREKAYQTSLRLKSALTYPALVLAVSLAMVVLVPPYVLEGQFRMLRESGQHLPLLTRVVMALSSALSTPWVLAPLVGSLGAGLAALSWAWRRPWLQAWGLRVALSTRGLGRALRVLATARFARALGLMYRVGVPLSLSLGVAAQAADNPLLESSIGAASQALLDGSSLAQSLGACRFFPQPFLHMLAAGEEAGKPEVLLDWVARLYEQELELSLESFLAMLEPLLMLGLGILVGVLLLATLLPMVGLLQTL